MKINLDNISMTDLAATLDPESELFLDLFGLEHLAKNTDLLIKVQRAVNNYVRARLENRLPTIDELETLIKVGTGEVDAGDQYNPLKCWNEQDREKDVKKLIKAIVKANIDLEMAQGCE